MKWLPIICLIVTSLFGHAQDTTTSDSRIIFQIGAFDGSSQEFAMGLPKQPVNYRVGKDKAIDWYAEQRIAGARDQQAVFAENEWKISFVLKDKPHDQYILHLAVLIENPCVPYIEVTINGKRGKAYLNPKLDDRAGDPNASESPVYSHADINLPIPSAYLMRGANVIALQPVSDGTDPLPDAVLVYDAVAMENANKNHMSNDTSAQILPTIFYLHHGDYLSELVDVIIRHEHPLRAHSAADLMLAGKTYHAILNDSDDFGESRIEIPVQEFPVKSLATLTWNIDGHLRRVSSVIVPQKKWTLLLVPHTHLDIGYTDYQAKVGVIQGRVIDEAMDLAKDNPGFSFSSDGEWSLDKFWNTRSETDRQRLLEAMKKRDIFIPAQSCNLLTGFPTAEVLIRSLYPSANFSRLHGTPFDYANITDVPSYTWSYSSILASSGIHYFLAGSNNTRAPVLLQGHLNEQSPFWWEGPDGQRVLMWYSRAYFQMQYLFGLPPKLSAGRDALPIFLQQYMHPSYRASSVILFGSQVENTDLFKEQATLAKRWNNRYAYPILEYSGVHDALQRIEAEGGTSIPVIRGDGGPYWEDGIASDAYYAAMEKNTESRALSAEKLTTIASLEDPQLAANMQELHRMWANMVLMDEHTWGSWDSVSDPTSRQAIDELKVKDTFALAAKAEVDNLAKGSMATLAELSAANHDSLVVFNMLNWMRSGLVEVDLPSDTEIIDPITGRAIPTEIVQTGNHYRRVRFLASDVPGVGYKIFKLNPASQTASVQKEEKTTTVLENAYYRIMIDPENGALSSIYDKQLGKELVNQENSYKFGQYLYVTGGDGGDNTMGNYSEALPRAKLSIHPAEGGKILSVAHVPWGVIARLESKAYNTPKIITEIELFNHEKKLEIIEDVTKRAVNTKEAVYFAFPFAMNHPTFNYEIQTATVDPERDMYPGAGHEWFSVQHWVSLEQGGIDATIMPLDASLVTLGDINRGKWPSRFADRQGTVFSYVMNNYWWTNYRASQGGEFRFRYVITSASKYNPTNLSRQGWEETTPLEVDDVTRSDRASDAVLASGEFEKSVLQIEDKNVLLETWKPAEDGRGTVLRFLDLGGSTRAIKVNFNLPNTELVRAWSTSAVEVDKEPLQTFGRHALQFTIHPHEIVTIRAVLRKAGGSDDVRESTAH